jgi:uncharacterized membrane protein YphA (DoxX/SURF4 family)
MRHLPTIARILLGLVFTVFGLNFFFHFIPNPPPPPPAAGAFAKALLASGYLFNLLKVLEVLCGVALLAGRFVPLALTVLAPIVVNIVFFHAFLHPAGLALPLVVVALEVFLAFCYRDAFRPMLQARTTPKL